METTLQTAPLSAAEKAVVRKAAWRLIPFLGLLYFVSFLDRVNVGFAALTMNVDLGLSASMFGLGAGIFFVGYLIFEVPSNLFLERFGARVWISRIMITWGVLAASTAFATDAITFLSIRFLLGIAEAGFFPGVILYLTYWFPGPVRGRLIGAFMVALPLSSAIGAPLSTWLMEQSVFGLRGWQTMFLMEGVPAVLLGVSVLFVLPDRPARARWLSDSERVVLSGMLAREASAGGRVGALKAAFAHPRVWGLGGVYFGLVLGVYGLGFWGPQIIGSLGSSTLREIGWLSAIPYAFAALATLGWGAFSDRSGRRTRDIAAAALVGAFGFALCALAPNAMLGLAGLVFAAAGVYAALPVFWTVPTALLAGSAAAGGIAMINALGNIGGYAAPWIIGLIRERTGGYDGGLWLLALGLVAAAVMVPMSGRTGPRRGDRSL